MIAFAADTAQQEPFEQATPVSAQSVKSAFEAYWQELLTHPDIARPALHVLQHELNLISAGQISSKDWQQDAHRVLAHSGFNGLIVEEPPMVDLIAWETEERRTWAVELEDTQRDVEVVLIDDMLSHGWQDYSTQGRIRTTGWVHEGRLYCLGWAYNLDSEHFQVSFLKHETRHLEDLERFPDLETSHLEYRAKLTELAFAVTTSHRLLKQFTHEADANGVTAHELANARLVAEFESRLFPDGLPEASNPWLLVSTPRINRLARSLLRQDTLALDRASNQAAH